MSNEQNKTDDIKNEESSISEANTTTNPGEHKLLIHHISDAYTVVSEGITNVANHSAEENLENAKKAAVDSFTTVKDGITHVATQENLELVKNKTIEGAVVAKDAVVYATSAVYDTVTQIDYNQKYEEARKSATDLWNSLW
ncbi:hypothetical protein AKO1_001647 [Acrasis kona]|uniref:Uncharacterized protein n=1 Tax=Acrasis kona TaxID=1008807 RepID=A0AAW2YN26_9EUKA